MLDTSDKEGKQCKFTLTNLKRKPILGGRYSSAFSTRTCGTEFPLSRQGRKKIHVQVLNHFIKLSNNKNIAIAYPAERSLCKSMHNCDHSIVYAEILTIKN
jgi:hypothetical protein